MLHFYLLCWDHQRDTSSGWMEAHIKVSGCRISDNTFWLPVKSLFVLSKPKTFLHLGPYHLFAVYTACSNAYHQQTVPANPAIDPVFQSAGWEQSVPIHSTPAWEGKKPGPHNSVILYTTNLQTCLYKYTIKIDSSPCMKGKFIYGFPAVLIKQRTICELFTLDGNVYSMCGF